MILPPMSINSAGNYTIGPLSLDVALITRITPTQFEDVRCHAVDNPISSAIHTNDMVAPRAKHDAVLSSLHNGNRAHRTRTQAPRAGMA